MRLPSGQKTTEWKARLPGVVPMYCSCLMCFFTTFFLTPLWWRQRPRGCFTSWAAGRRIPQRGTRHTYPSSCPAPYCSPCCAADGLSGGQACHRDLDAWPYPCTHPPFGSRGAGYQCMQRSPYPTLSWI